MSYYNNSYSPYPTIMQMPQTIAGRLVAGVGEISVADVPQDGRKYYFPTADGEAIYVKSWNVSGTIDTVRFVPERSPEPISGAVSVEPEREVETGILRRLEALERMVGVAAED